MGRSLIEAELWTAAFARAVSVTGARQAAKKNEMVGRRGLLRLGSFCDGTAPSCKKKEVNEKGSAHGRNETRPSALGGSHREPAHPEITLNDS